MAVRDETVRFVYSTTGDQDLADTAGLLVKMADAGKLTDAESLKLAASLKTLAAQSKAVNDALSQKAGLGETANQIKIAEAAFAKLRAETDATVTASKAYKKELTSTAQSIVDLTAKQNAQQVALTKTEGALQKAGVDTANLAAASTTLNTQAAGVATRLVAVGNAAASAATGTNQLSAVGAKLNAAFQSARDGVNSFGSGLLRITGIAGAVSAALGAISIGKLFGGAVSSAKDFEAALSQVQAVSGATADELRQMRQAAEDASKSTKFSATEAAGALGELARASGNARDAIAELPATLTLAQAAGIGAADSAQILTTAITQFGLSAADATRVADLFAREANSTNDDVTSLGNSLSYVAPLAKQLGLSIETTTASLGALAEQGFKGERAGTALRNVFSQLLDPTSNFRNALNGLGIEGNDFSTIITKLAAAGEKGKAALLALDSEARPAISALVSSGGAGIRRLTEDFKNAAGEAQRTATIMGQNFSGASSRLANAFDALRRSLVDPILAPLSKQFDEAAAKVRGFAESADFGRIKAAVLDFATSATDAIVKFVGSVNFTTVSNSIRDFATTAKTFFGDLKQSAGSVGTAFSVVGGTISTIFNGAKAVVFTAAGVIAGGLGLIAKASLTAAEGAAVLNGSYAGLKPRFDEIRLSINGVIAVANDFSDRAAAAGTSAVAAFQDVATAVSSTAPAAQAAAAAQKTVADQLNLTADQATKLAQEFLDLPPSLQSIAEPGLRAAGVFSKITEESAKSQIGLKETADALSQAKNAAAAAYNDLARVAGTGDTTSAAFHKAKDALDAANQALAVLSGQSQKATEASTALAAAQSRLGQTHEQLGATAKTAARDLDVIYASFLAGTSSIEDVRTAFLKYADAQIQAVAYSDSWKQQTVHDLLDVKAAALGLSDLKLPPLELPTAPLKAFHQEIQAGTEANEKYIQSTEERGKAIEDASAETESARGTMASFSYELQGVGAAGVKAFQDIQNAALKFLIEDTGGAGLQLYIEAINSGTEKLNAGIKAQQEAANALIAQASNTTDAQLAAMAKTAGGAEALAAQLRGVNNGFTLIDGQTLSAVQGATEALASRLEALKQKTDAALQSFLDFSSSVQDQLDEEAGNQEAIEKRRHEKQLANLQEEAEASGTLNSKEYRDALAAEEKLHQLKLKHIKEQKEAAKPDGGGGGGGSPDAPTVSDPPTRPPSGPAPAGGSAAPIPNAPLRGAGSGPVTININGQLDPKGIEDLSRKIRKVLEDIDGRST